MRREQTLLRKLPLLIVEEEAEPDTAAPTDPLRLVFTCCHPALGRDAQLALTLRLMCGLTTAEIGNKETAIRMATQPSRRSPRPVCRSESPQTPNFPRGWTPC